MNKVTTTSMQVKLIITTASKNVGFEVTGCSGIRNKEQCLTSSDGGDGSPCRWCCGSSCHQSWYEHQTCRSEKTLLQFEDYVGYSFNGYGQGNCPGDAPSLICYSWACTPAPLATATWATPASPFTVCVHRVVFGWDYES